MAEGNIAGAAKSPQLEQQTDILAKTMDESHVLMNDLENKLGCVTRDAAPTPDGNGALAESESLVTAAAYVRDQTRKGQLLNSRIASLLDRLEV